MGLFIAVCIISCILPSSKLVLQCWGPFAYSADSDPGLLLVLGQGRTSQLLSNNSRSAKRKHNTSLSYGKVCGHQVMDHLQFFTCIPIANHREKAFVFQLIFVWAASLLKLEWDHSFICLLVRSFIHDDLLDHHFTDISFLDSQCFQQWRTSNILKFLKIQWCICLENNPRWTYNTAKDQQLTNENVFHGILY